VYIRSFFQIGTFLEIVSDDALVIHILRTPPQMELGATDSTHKSAHPLQYKKEKKKERENMVRGPVSVISTPLPVQIHTS
jgi:hypothetical protein